MFINEIMDKYVKKINCDQIECIGHLKLRFQSTSQLRINLKIRLNAFVTSDSNDFFLKYLDTECGLDVTLWQFW